MKIVLYEVVTWTWQKYFGSISLSLHTKKADQSPGRDHSLPNDFWVEASKPSGGGGAGF